MKKKDIEVYEKKKSSLYGTVLSCIGGLILVWCAITFIPMTDFYLLLNMGLPNASTTIVVATYISLIVAIALVLFTIGFYGIKRCIIPTIVKEENKIREEENKNAKKQQA